MGDFSSPFQMLQVETSSSFQLIMTLGKRLHLLVLCVHIPELLHKTVQPGRKGHGFRIQIVLEQVKLLITEILARPFNFSKSQFPHMLRLLGDSRDKLHKVLST